MKYLLSQILQVLILIHHSLQEKNELISVRIEKEVWLDSHEAKAYLNICPSTLYRRRMAGEFIVKRKGKGWLYLKSSLK